MQTVIAIIGLFFGVDLLFQAARAYKNGKATYRLRHYTREGTPRNYWVFIIYCGVAGIFFCLSAAFIVLYG